MLIAINDTTTKYFPGYLTHRITNTTFLKYCYHHMNLNRSTVIYWITSNQGVENTLNTLKAEDVA